MYPYLAVPQCCCSFQGQLTQCCAGHKTSPFLHSFISHYWLVCLCVCVFVHKRLSVWVYMTRQRRWCAANPLQLVSNTEEDPSMNPLMFMSLYMQNTLKCKLVKVSHFALSYKSDDVTSCQCHLFSMACVFCVSNMTHTSFIYWIDLKLHFCYTCQQKVDWKCLPDMNISYGNKTELCCLAYLQKTMEISVLLAAA